MINFSKVSAVGFVLAAFAAASQAAIIINVSPWQGQTVGTGSVDINPDAFTDGTFYGANTELTGSFTFKSTSNQAVGVDVNLGSIEYGFGSLAITSTTTAAVSPTNLTGSILDVSGSTNTFGGTLTQSVFPTTITASANTDYTVTWKAKLSAFNSDAYASISQIHYVFHEYGTVPNPTPEPATMSFIGASLIGIVARRRNKK